jgi:hypothetical protein
MVGRGRGGDIRLGFGVDWDSLVGDVSDISVVVVRGVLNMLGTTIGKSNIVRSRNNTGSISSLSSVEVSLGVVISNSVLVGVGFINMSWLNISSMSWGISWGSMDNWGMVDSMGNWVSNKSMVSKWMGNKSMVGNWVSNKSMVGNWVGNKSMVGNWVSNKSMVGHWVGNKSMVGNWVGNKSMVGKWVSNKSMMSSMAAMRDNSTMSMADHMG